MRFMNGDTQHAEAANAIMLPRIARIPAALRTPDAIYARACGIGGCKVGGNDQNDEFLVEWRGKTLLLVAHGADAGFRAAPWHFDGWVGCTREARNMWTLGGSSRGHARA